MSLKKELIHGYHDINNALRYFLCQPTVEDTGEQANSLTFLKAMQDYFQPLNDTFHDESIKADVVDAIRSGLSDRGVFNIAKTEYKLLMVPGFGINNNSILFKYSDSYGIDLNFTVLKEKKEDSDYTIMSYHTNENGLTEPFKPEQREALSVILQNLQVSLDSLFGVMEREEYKKNVDELAQPVFLYQVNDRDLARTLKNKFDSINISANIVLSENCVPTAKFYICENDPAYYDFITTKKGTSITEILKKCENDFLSVLEIPIYYMEQWMIDIYHNYLRKQANESSNKVPIKEKTNL